MWKLSERLIPKRTRGVWALPPSKWALTSWRLLDDEREKRLNVLPCYPILQSRSPPIPHLTPVPNSSMDHSPSSLSDDIAVLKSQFSYPLIQRSALLRTATQPKLPYTLVSLLDSQWSLQPANFMKMVLLSILYLNYTLFVPSIPVSNLFLHMTGLSRSWYNCMSRFSARISRPD